MNILLLLITIVSLCISVLVATHLFRQIHTQEPRGRSIPILIIGLIYAILSAISLLWSINLLEFSRADFFIVYSIVMAVQSMALITMLFKLSGNRKILYSFLIFGLSIPLTLLDPSYFHLTIPISLLIMVMTFLTFSDSYKKYVLILVAYTSLSLIFYIISLIIENSLIFLNLISVIIFLIFINSFLKDIKETPEVQHLHPKIPTSPTIHFLKHFIFIIIITNFIFIGTITTHEFGHVLMAQSADCQDIKIVYELRGLPHTEINCSNISEKQKWAMGGLLLPFLVAALLMFGGGKSVKEFALQIIGFNLIIAYSDIQVMGFSETIATFTTIFGVCLSILSLALLAKSRTD